MAKDEKRTPFCDKWSVYRKIGENMYLMYRYEHQRILILPLMIIRFQFLQPHYLTEAEKFNIRYSNPDLIPYTGDKLRYYRYKKGLLQREVADYAGIDRQTYATYETHRISYPREKIEIIAQLLEVEPRKLLDDYNYFVYDGQGKRIRSIRKSMLLTQKQFAALFGVVQSTVKQWEQERVQIQKNTYLKLMQLCDSSISAVGAHIGD